MTPAQQLALVRAAIQENHPQQAEILESLEKNLRQEEPHTYRKGGEKTEVRVRYFALWDYSADRALHPDDLATRYCEILQEEQGRGFVFRHSMAANSGRDNLLVFERQRHQSRTYYNIHDVVRELRAIAATGKGRGLTGQAIPLANADTAGDIADLLEPRHRSLHLIEAPEIARILHRVWVEALERALSISNGKSYIFARPTEEVNE